MGRGELGGSEELSLIDRQSRTYSDDTEASALWCGVACAPCTEGP